MLPKVLTWVSHGFGRKHSAQAILTAFALAGGGCTDGETVSPRAGREVPFSQLFVLDRALRLEVAESNPIGDPVAVLVWGGRLAVLDAMQASVRLYDLEGRLLQEIGGPGDGPGEFRNPRAATITAEQQLLVFDVATQLITVFDPDGNYVNRFQSPVPVVGGLLPLGRDLIASGYRADALHAAGGSEFVPLHRIATEGALIEGFGRWRLDLRPEHRFIGDLLVATLSDTLFVVARRSGSSVLLINSRTREQHEINAAYPGYKTPELPRTQIADVIQLIEWVKQQELTSGLLRLDADHFAVSFSRTLPSGENRHTYSVLDPTGRLIFSTVPDSRLLRPLDSGRYYSIHLEEDGSAILELFALGAGVTGEQVRLSR